MDDAAKKTALRMIPYGIYVLTACHPDGTIAAATINWLTQSSFDPPLIVFAVKADSGAHAALSATRKGAISILGKGQQGLAFTFFKPAVAEGETLSGQPVRTGKTGAPILTAAPASIEIEVLDIVARGDHHLFVAQVTDASLTEEIGGRPDDAVLAMRDLGEKVFYGG